MITIHDLEQGSEAWHAIRAGKYTGSNAHKLLRFGTIEYARTERSVFKGNFYTERGHTLEAEAIELYEQIYDHSVQRPGFVTNSAYPDCGYSPDGIQGLSGHRPAVFEPGAILLECKAFQEGKHKTIASGDIPVEILAQIHFGMLITGLRKARLILYNPDIEDPNLALVVLDIAYNRNIQTNFKRILKEGKNALHTQTAHA